MDMYRPKLLPISPSRFEAYNARYRFDPPLAPRVASIIMEVSNRCEQFASDIMSDCRKRITVKARNEIIYRLRLLEPMPSFPMIGKWMGRDHTSCMWAVARHARDNNLPSITTYDSEKVRKNNAAARARHRLKKVAASRLVHEDPTPQRRRLMEEGRI